MNDATCKTCSYFSQNNYGREHNRGECRCHAPVAIELPGEYLNFPVMEPDDWCGEHPSLAPKMESVVGSIECVTKDDVKLIVAQAIEAEMMRATQAQRAYPRHTKAT